MQSDGTDFGSRLGQVAAQVAALEARVDELSRLVLGSLPKSAAVEPRELSGNDSAPSQSVPGRISAPAALTALAVVCFLMVVALILRALTDGKIINQQFGTSLGIGYAALLVMSGYRGHGKNKPHAPIFSVCGALLLFSIVFETHARFQALSTPVAFVVLGAALAVMTVLGLRSRCALLVCLGLLGSTLVGMALDFPNPLFPALAVLLFLANGAAHLSRRVPRCSWLRWPLLLLTVFFWYLWTVKARGSLAGMHGPSTGLALAWILPGLVVFLAGALAIVAVAVVDRAALVGAYEILLPPLAAAGAVAISVSLLVPYYGYPALASAIGVGAALVPLVLALWSSAKGDRGGGVVPALVMAAMIPLAVFLPGSVGNYSLVMLICSFVAAAVVLTPALGRHGPVCAVSHLFQAFVCGMAVWKGCLSLNTLSSGGAMAVSALAGGICLVHYAVSRKWTTGADSLSEGPPSPAYYTMALPFTAGLVYLYGLSRMALFLIVDRVGTSADAFQAGQSLLINAGAITLATVGIELLYGDVVVIAVAVAGIGAGKVFLYDLPHLHGIPVILSVLSTGITTAVGAVLWTRWQKRSGA